MQVWQTVSPEIADRDFWPFSGDLRLEMQSLFVAASANLLKQRNYLTSKPETPFCRGWLAGEPGFEPGLTESESAGLPLTYSPKPFRHAAGGDCDPDGRRFTHG